MIQKAPVGTVVYAKKHVSQRNRPKGVNMIKNYFIHYWALWNGVAFQAFSGYSLTDWQWWAFCIPMCILVILHDFRAVSNNKFEPTRK